MKIHPIARTTLKTRKESGKALGYVSPVEALKKWQKSNPDLFYKKVYKQAGLDSDGVRVIV